MQSNLGVSALEAKIEQYMETMVPPGMVIAFAGAVVPIGWLLCDGSVINRSTYSKLFTAINIIYGIGDNSTTFSLPDYRGRVLAGKDDMGGSAANRLTAAGAGITGISLGASGGAQTHILTEAQLASHTHVQNAHLHAIHGIAQQGVNSGQADDITAGSAFLRNTELATAINQNTGLGSAHQNTQPTIITNYIIKV